MSDDVADVSMPEDEVDDAAAYFGVFESSDALHQMMKYQKMPLKILLATFDLVLKHGILISKSQ